MRTLWTKMKTPPSAFADRFHVVRQDFLKMFVAALVCSIVFSILAAGLVLLVMCNADASVPDDKGARPKARSGAESAERLAPLVGSIPGVLTIGAGSDAETLADIDSDWRVRVNETSVEVRVMQDYLIPAKALKRASFQTMLPAEAVFVELKVHTARNTLVGKTMAHAGLAGLNRVAMRERPESKQLIVVCNDRRVQTQAIPDLQPNETITLEYSYVMPLEVTAGQTSFNLLLNPAMPLMVATNDMTALVVEWPVPSRMSVWVEWIGPAPTTISTMPEATVVEHSRSRISGLSWTSMAPQLGRRFQIAWPR